MTTHEQVVISQDGQVLEFLLNNTQNGNEITGHMFDAMLDAVKHQAENPTATILRIRAKGDHFCTGRERSARTIEEVHHEVERLIQFKQLLRTLPLITIAEVEGDAQGFGFGLAILCDYAISSEDASLCFPEIKFGLPPSAIMAYLAEYIPPRFAFHLVVTGEPISPLKAAEIGLITESVPRDQVKNRADAIVQEILSLDENAVRECKQFFQKTLQNTFHQNIQLAMDSLTIGSLKLNERKLNREGSLA